MEVIKNEGQPDSPTPETPKPTHEQYVKQFAGELNEILSKGYPLTAVMQVLEAAVFEFKMNLYFQQMEAAERERQRQTKLQIPNMKIPTGKMK